LPSAEYWQLIKRRFRHSAPAQGRRARPASPRVERAGREQTSLDYHKTVATIPAAEAFLPLKEYGWYPLVLCCGK
jgi:hypothetical protein